VKAFRTHLEAEDAPGRLYLAGIAIAFATGSSEIDGRRFAERVHDLRRPRADSGNEPMSDVQILIMLNRPTKGTA
jgi:hypothetical protein